MNGAREIRPDGRRHGGDPGTSSGCVTADPALLADILAHAPQYDVNLHNPAYPAGAVRCQLFKG